MIVKTASKKYRLYSEDKKNLGVFNSLTEAKVREREYDIRRAHQKRMEIRSQSIVKLG